MGQPAIIVWDFDGVLNRNIVGGQFIWSDRMDAELGLDCEAFDEFLFRSHRMKQAITGQVDIREFVAEWLADQVTDVTAEAFLAFWFQNDLYPDVPVLDLLRAHRARHVIGTNNEDRRVRAIEAVPEFMAHVRCVFASGRMKVAKPADGFFEVVEVWAGVPATEILLVDDTDANVEAAVARGWRGFLFNDETRSCLPEYLGLAG